MPEPRYVLVLEAEFRALASEIEALEEPSREMDARVWLALDGNVEPPMQRHLWRLTASLDAAMALQRELLPGWETDIEEMTEHHAKVSLRGYRDGDYAEAEGPRAACVWIAAVIRARAVKEDSDVRE